MVRLKHWRPNFRRYTGAAQTPEEQPLRAGLFSVHQLEQHAAAVAGMHQLAGSPGPDKLIARLMENERILLRTYDLLALAVEQDYQITPAAEWLLDNFYVIEEQVLMARRHLPRSYSQALPQLLRGPAEGMPRVYGIAMELISHVDGGVDTVNLDAFVASYQAHTPLLLGELWAIPIMLRLGLLENLRRVAVHLATALNDRDDATRWAERMVQVVEENPSDLVLVLADMARANPPLTSTFVAELMRHLHGQSPHFAFAHSWLEHRIAEQGLTSLQLIQMESHAQAADQISIGNSITSLRYLSATDWRDFVEKHSVVEQILWREPAGIYADMSFATRNSYRSVIESIARHGDLSEAAVARQAIRLTVAAASTQPESREAHVGYYLVDKGREELERISRVRSTPVLFARKMINQHPMYFYAAAILAITMCISGGLLTWAQRGGVPPWMVLLLTAPVLMCALHVSIGAVNWLSTTLIAPRPLPRMDFRNGIPREHRTMVVVPTMLGDAQTVRDLLDRLEIHYAANRDPHLHFALLTDLRDAPQEVMPEDEAQIQQVREGIESLNRKYLHDRADIFFLFHRPRRWNAVDGVWMGHERKRGKLEDFNGLLRGESTDAFSETVGELSLLPQIKYVITLDTDTQLPRDAARDLTGAMAHPLNRPVLDATGRRVVEGHGILQPRVATNLPTASRSWFVRLFASDTGLDPYTRVVSDVYQDLFGEGSFIGKGIYDVDAFRETCMHFPGNTILSHDLLEGVHARSGLLTDVELYEDHPSRYSVDASRRHRWVRGDWQIAGWLLPRVPGRDGTRRSNPLSSLSWWKICDNLRRSLVPPAMVSLLLFAWLLPWGPLAAGVTIFVLLVVAAIPLLSVTAEVGRKPPDLTWGLHLRAFGPALARRLGQFLFTLTFLPHEAYLNLDAIVRTLARMGWTRRKLLEWTTSSDAERKMGNDFKSYARSMRVAPLLAAAGMGVIAIAQPTNLLPGAPLLGLWLISPIAAWYLSRTIVSPPPHLSAEQHLFLKKLARKTWRYFEVFVTEDENWLPPDNFQERPAPKVASRTSPTNIGVALLSNLSAYDFGYGSAAQLLKRSEDTLASLGRLERHRGHFYNWYNTQTLEPLLPLYVSTVDSGNLALHLIILQRGLLNLIDERVIPERLFEGLQDTARVLSDAASAAIASPSLGQLTPQLIAIFEKSDALAALLDDAPRQARAVARLLERVTACAEELASIDCRENESSWWSHALQRGAASHGHDLAHLAPWAMLPAPPERIWNSESPGIQARLDELRDLLEQLDAVPSLRGLAGLEERLLRAIDAALGAPGAAPSTVPREHAAWLADLRTAVVIAARHAGQRILDLEAAAKHCEDFATMDFAFLCEEDRDLMSIGYNISDNRLDSGCYDLLASEARVASYLAIAQGQVGQEHWFALRRMLTTSTGLPALLSWNGSMFEYLMPLLVMPTYENTLLDKTYRAVVQRQIDYGKQLGLPWGISESGYNTQDVHLNYQYRGFGVPGLGLKRGLVEDRVVAPYATMLALMVAPEAACRNLERLSTEGREGAYGLYEAIDYTPSRQPRNADGVTIWSYMAHHQGMSLLSLAYLLHGKPMQRRFESDPTLRATELLLQERIPRRTAPIFPHAIEVGASRVAQGAADEPMRILTDPSVGAPEVHLLSNGRYHVMVSSAGGGYSKWHDLAVTRWREDPTRDHWGAFCYLRDLDTGRFWSVGYQPTLKLSEPYEAVFVQAKAEFRRRDDRIELHTEISVSPEDDIELRRTTITNRSDRPRSIEVTSYAEVVLAPAGQDLTHPSFSNLFVQTELLRNQDAILCTRRPRSATEKPPWLAHLMNVQGDVTGKISFETSRQNFIGRGRSLDHPAAMDGYGRLSDTEGSVLDPVVAIRRTIRLQPHETARVDIVTGVADTRDAVAGLAEKYHDPRLSDRVFELAWTHSQVELRHINATETDAQLYLRLAGALIYASALRRAGAEILSRNRSAQSGLWGHGISGDLPIVLIRIRDHDKLDLVRQVFQAHAYWRLKGLIVDLVIWNEDESVYRQDLFDTIMDLIAASPEAGFVDKPGGVYLRRGEHIPEVDRVLLQAAARIVLADDAGTLREQVELRRRPEAAVPPLKPVRRLTEPLAARESPKPDLAHFNGLGGFTHDGKEYITHLRPGLNTPAPWVNVIANPHFGTLVSESGSVYTWSENCHEFRITPWSNDPVSNVSGEAVYLRDEETGRVWSPTPQPARGSKTYSARHGFGYSVFEYEDDGLASVMTVYVSLNDPVKFVRLRVANRSGRPRKLSATAYWELVLGELRCRTLMHVVTRLDAQTGAIFAHNAYSTEFGGRVAFFDTSELMHTVTGDRSEFLGRNGMSADPAALRRTRLSGRTGAGFDPCAAIQTPFQLQDGEEKEVVFVMGAAQSEEEAQVIVQRTHGVAQAQQALEEVWRYWGHTLGALFVETPDTALNFLVNGWLPYQTIACRLWGRTGFYQSGGAFGFRDQLQDSMALVHAAPDLVRQHLLRATARQFLEGDVQHWWHAHSGRGVRTHFSDDYLWLPYTVCRYVHATGDTGVLDEKVPYLDARTVRPEEEGYYDLPLISGEMGTVYEHCERAIKNGLRFGDHGLPLMGCGDWNDGMNLVGKDGKGESVWLAFFLYDVLTRFADLARQHGETAFAGTCETEAKELRLRIDAGAWDGEWYRRAYFDDGGPLGSAENVECQIDSIAQSWSVLSGAGEPGRARQAMESVNQRLVRRNARLVQLFDPPFDTSELDPGYIKGYTPGVRENGGQYTHAAIWVAMAFAALKDPIRAWEMFALLNPVNHANTPANTQVYRVEPYVVAADVYSATPHTGRGGWTWYTGSSSWMYRLITESLLGLHLETGRLIFTPCLPADWPSFKVHYRYRETCYHITVRNGGGGNTVNQVRIDGSVHTEMTLPLVDDHIDHEVEIMLD
ncbi:MAG: cyclic beta 1-2 glucan synthetase [Candidatus Hydrogenedentes bacterium]|nr:cyclic beta 1-2 glucan synthetase [Candidatus Hydrogenedentota bacterium]